MSESSLHRHSPDGPRVAVRGGEQDEPVDGAANDRLVADIPAPDASLPESLSLDVVFGLLSVERRRRTLIELRQTDGQTTLSDLATRLAALENDIPEGRVTSDQRKRVYIALYQSHLPKLDDADVIEFDQARGTVELGSNASVLYPYLDLGDAMASDTSERSNPLRRRLARWFPGLPSA